MKIIGISVYQFDIELQEGSYRWSSGKGVSHFDSTIVQIHTDAGIPGWGEVCPLGANYLPSFAEGVRTGIKKLGPYLIGTNPLELQKFNDTMDYHLKGHPGVKAPLDIACWDILGKYCKLPVCTLIGGRYGPNVKVRRSISRAEPEEMIKKCLNYKKKGFTKFQLKLGGNPEDDIERLRLMRGALQPSDLLIGDANGAWLPHQALRVLNGVHDLDVHIEQPCATYEECLAIRQHTSLPIILDEIITDVTSVARARQDGAADVISIKLSKMGGLTKSKQVRDLCVAMGFAVSIEDSWGSDIVTSAIAHLAHSTPEKYRFSCSDLSGYNRNHVAIGGPIRGEGYIEASRAPGLGVQPIMRVLGDPVFTIGETSS